MSSWETGDDDRAACPVLSLNATPWSWCERPADRSRRWHCCIKRSARSPSTSAPKSPAAYCEMAVLRGLSPTPEVPAHRLCHPSWAPFPLMQQSRGPSARPRGRAGGRPAWRWPTSCSTLSKPAGDGSTATGSLRPTALASSSSTGNCHKGTTTNGSLRGRRPRELLAMINDLPCLSLWGRASAGTADVRNYRIRPWRVAGQSGLLHRSKVGQVGFLQELLSTSGSHEIHKTVKSAGQEDTVAPPTAGRDRDDDIVRLALAILDEELRSWVKTRHRGRASHAEGVLEPHEQSVDAS